MREADAQVVLLVRAFERTDAEGRVLPLGDRARAASRTGQTTDEEFLVARAQTLLDRLADQLPALSHLRRGARLGRGVVVTLLIVALVVGLFTNALGPERLINVLSLPLLAIIAWNLVVYLVLAVVAVAGSSRAAPARTEPSLLGRMAEALLTRAWRLGVTEKREITARALAAFLDDWRVATGPLATARLRRLLHVAAGALMAGAVAGMYVRGLGLAYRVTWESTFLDADTVQSLLGVVLGPASAVLGRGVPDVAPLAAPARGDAAPWIHLYAVSAALYVLVPRALLALAETRAIGRLAADVPVDLGSAYFRRLLAPAGGEQVLIQVLPYSRELAGRELDGLRTTLHDTFGARAAVELAPVIGYGDDVPAPSRRQTARQCVRAVIFALSASPESEVHGRFLQDCKRDLADDERLCVLIDAASFRERLGTGERAEQRRRAWDRVVVEAGLQAVHVDLGQPVDDEVVGQLSGTLWPSESAS